jgi:hypothetical protein
MASRVCNYLGIEKTQVVIIVTNLGLSPETCTYVFGPSNLSLCAESILLNLQTSKEITTTVEVITVKLHLTFHYISVHKMTPSQSKHLPGK